MNKKELAQVYKRINTDNITIKKGIQEIEIFLETLKEALMMNKKVKFLEKGVFEIVERKSKVISNPSTRELMKIYPPKIVKFRVSKNLLK